MTQHLNLLDASFERRRDPLGSTGAGVLVGVTVLAVFAALVALRALTGAAQARADDLARQLADLQGRVAALPASTAPVGQEEAERLRSAEAVQARLIGAIEASGGSPGTGYSAYLLALSRQTRPRLWLTGFSVSADGRDLTIAGRMSEPRELPEYLRRLNAEPLFRGREFAQLNLKVPAPAAGGGDVVDGLVDFTLRSAIAEVRR